MSGAIPSTVAIPMSRFDRLVKDSLFNFLGLGAPLVAAVFAIPILIRELGGERFGLLTLIWAVVSYFGLFDLGLGRAMTQRTALALSSGRREEVVPVLWSGMSLLVGLGIVAGTVMIGLVDQGVAAVKSIPDIAEAKRAGYAMAFAMPFIIGTSGLRGALEGQSAFRLVNLIRLPMGLFTFLGPLVTIALGFRGLDQICYVLVAGRVLGFAAHAVGVWTSLATFDRRLEIRRDFLRHLAVSGGWLSVSNVVSPFMGYFDRFVIGATVSALAVAYYATPNELVTKLWIVPGALTGVLLPVFAGEILDRKNRLRHLFAQASFAVFFVTLPLAAGLGLFSREILSLWISADFSNQSAAILQVFSIGILINCMAHVPLTLLQGAGRYRTPALIHLLELPIYLAVLWSLTTRWGAIGAAYAWLLRMSFDTLFMICACVPLLGVSMTRFFGWRLLVCVSLFVVAMFGIMIEPVVSRAVWFVAFAFVPAIAGLTLLLRTQFPILGGKS